MLSRLPTASSMKRNLRHSYHLSESVNGATSFSGSFNVSRFAQWQCSCFNRVESFDSTTFCMYL